MSEASKSFLSLTALAALLLVTCNACQSDPPKSSVVNTPPAESVDENNSITTLAAEAAPINTPQPISPAVQESPQPTQPPTDSPTASPTSTQTLLPSPSYGIASTTLSETDGMTMVYVPQGEFLMGLSGEAFYQLSEDIFAECPGCKMYQSHERPEHPVYLDAYWIDQSEVTNAMYARCAADGVCEIPGPQENEFTAEILYGKPGFEDFPMVNVNWFHAQTYCEWAGRRMPTEAEWEKAARGTDGRRFPWGEETGCQYANYKDCAINSLTRVGRYPKGASPYGTLDMAGNAQEWVADWYSESYYDLSDYNNPQGPEEGTARVIRDGNWEGWSYLMRTTARSKLRPEIHYFFNLVGFRCALSADALTEDQVALITPVAVKPTTTPLPSPTPTEPVWPDVTPVVISPYCSVDSDSPVSIQADQPVTLKWSWSAKTAEMVQEHIDVAKYTIRFEDQPVNPHRRSKIEHISDGDFYRVTWYADLGMLLPGEYYAARGLEWSEQISDGWNTYGPGGEFEIVFDNCYITVDPPADKRYQSAPACMLDMWQEIVLVPDALILTHPDIVQGEPVANPGGSLYMMSYAPWWGPLNEDTAGYGFWYGIGDTPGPDGGLLGYVWEADIAGCGE
jgi:formylglycine-generating enzyme required for sulfatase activity